jgi:hypothetical protein
VFSRLQAASGRFLLKAMPEEIWLDYTAAITERAGGVAIVEELLRLKK